MSDEIRTIRSEVRVRGADNIEMKLGAPAAVYVIMWTSWLAGTAANVYAIAAGVSWPFAFGFFMFWIGAHTHALAWRATARRLAIGLFAATDESLRLRPQVPKARARKGKR